MPIVLAPNQIHTEVHPGEYEIQVIHGGPVAYYEDGELPKAVSDQATVKTPGRLHVLASDHALVSVEDVTGSAPAKKSAAKKK